MPTNFRLEPIEPSARDVEGQKFVLSSDAVSSLARLKPCSLNLPQLPPSFLQKINTSLSDSISSKRKFVDSFTKIQVGLRRFPRPTIVTSLRIFFIA